MSNTKERALIYCRVSDIKQTREGSGLLSQEQRCRTVATEMGLRVEQVFRDEISGGSDVENRPGMVALLRHLKANTHQTMLCCSTI